MKLLQQQSLEGQGQELGGPQLSISGKCRRKTGWLLTEQYCAWLAQLLHSPEHTGG